ncbi:MAG: NAD-dependent epimerase/dehydratase family protein, partial [Actinomycetota bacterium]|nr:NAD-dependent epimerase/dehydratase family protein [Actinomycetota bacterium]
MRVFVAGVDGYLGWSLAQHLAARGHEVGGADAFLRRKWVDEMSSWSATPVVDVDERLVAFKERYDSDLRFWEGDLCDLEFVDEIFSEFKP